MLLHHALIRIVTHPGFWLKLLAADMQINLLRPELQRISLGVWRACGSEAFKPHAHHPLIEFDRGIQILHRQN